MIYSLNTRSFISADYDCFMQEGFFFVHHFLLVSAPIEEQIQIVLKSEPGMNNHA
jgi:hypothetical protein